MKQYFKNRPEEEMIYEFKQKYNLTDGDIKIGCHREIGIGLKDLYYYNDELFLTIKFNREMLKWEIEKFF